MRPPRSITSTTSGVVDSLPLGDSQIDLIVEAGLQTVTLNAAAIVRLIATDDSHYVSQQAGGNCMPLFVIERNFAEQLDPDELDRDGIKAVNDDTGVRWIYSFL